MPNQALEGMLAAFRTNPGNGAVVLLDTLIEREPQTGGARSYTWEVQVRTTSNCSLEQGLAATLARLQSMSEVSLQGWYRLQRVGVVGRQVGRVIVRYPTGVSGLLSTLASDLLGQGVLLLGEGHPQLGSRLQGGRARITLEVGR